jgi:hypothetical protein
LALARHFPPAIVNHVRLSGEAGSPPFRFLTSAVIYHHLCGLAL